MSDKPGIYFLLGADEPGRFEVIKELVESIADEQETWVISWGADSKLPDLSIAKGKVLKLAPEDSYNALLDCPEDTVCFILSDGKADPLDQVESFRDLLSQGAFELLRIISVINLRMLHEHSELKVWYEACLHFSDVAVLVDWLTIPPKSFTAWEKEYARLRNPCLTIKMTKKGINNPSLVLYPEARRISAIFDEEEQIFYDGIEIEEGDEDEDGYSESSGEDPWLERLPGGSRRKHIPQIIRFLS